MPRYLFTLQYAGTAYAGWQTQANALAIQPLVERALSALCKEPIRLHGAGRTDAGVHALAQQAHADLPGGIPERGLVLGLNNMLPPDIRIVSVREVAPDFHARFSAIGKSYRYAIWNDPVFDVFHRETCAHVTSPLDEGEMRRAAAALVGEHDFRAFTVAEPEVSSTVRTIRSVEVERAGKQVLITISADGFLRYMVRRIAGSLIEVGRGRLPAGAIAASLEPEFREARWTAAAAGLVLVGVSYGD
jgi:tRNA pseudouridine38-40 synthase